MTLIWKMRNLNITDFSYHIGIFDLVGYGLAGREAGQSHFTQAALWTFVADGS